MGTVTTGVSLPREWVERNRLGVASAVYLQVLEDDSLLVRRLSPDEGPRAVQLTRSRSSPPEHLFRSLISAYLDGAEEFRVREPGGLSAETRGIAAYFARRTIRPEIVSEDSSEIVLRDVSRGGELDLAPRLRRVHQVVLRLHEEAATTLLRGSEVGGTEWGVRDDDVDRQAWLVERILSLRSPSRQSGLPGPLASIARTVIVVRSLERAGDHAVLIAEYGARWRDTSPPAPVLQTVAQFHTQARELLAAALPAALRGDTREANDLIDAGEALHAQYRALVESTLDRRRGAEERRGELAFLLPSIDRTVAYAQDIAEAGLGSGTTVLETGSAGGPSRSSHTVERGGKRKR